MSDAVTIVDYGAGNLRSVANIFDFAGVEATICGDPDRIAKADRLVLPGVGAAGFVLDRLAESGVGDALESAVRRRGVPLLCICVGMQILGQRVTEFGERPGLGWVKGQVIALADRAAPEERVPHMRWSAVEPGDAAPEWMVGALRREVYFCHAFAMVGAEASQTAAWHPAYGGFAAALAFDTVAAMQFHPEKSQVAGLELIEGFCDWAP